MSSLANPEFCFMCEQNYRRGGWGGGRWDGGWWDGGRWEGLGTRHLAAERLLVVTGGGS